MFMHESNHMHHLGPIGLECILPGSNDLLQAKAPLGSLSEVCPEWKALCRQQANLCHLFNTPEVAEMGAVVHKVAIGVVLQGQNGADWQAKLCDEAVAKCTKLFRIRDRVQWCSCL